MSSNEPAGAWRDFLSRGRTSDYFAALDRRAAGRSPLAAFVIGLEPYPDVTAALREIQLPLRNVPAVECVPPHLLMITLLALGFVAEETGGDAISKADLAALAQAAAPVAGVFAPFDLRMGGASSLADRAFVEVADGGALGRLRELLVGVLPVALAAPPEREPWPRVDIAYYTGERDVRQAAEALETFRTREPQSITVRALDLIAVPVIRARRFAPPALLRRYDMGGR